MWALGLSISLSSSPDRWLRLEHSLSLLCGTNMAGGGPASKGGAVGKVIRASEMEKMTVDQLKALKEQSDLEVNLLQDSLNNIRTAASRLEIASNALHDLSLRPQGPSLPFSNKSHHLDIFPNF